MSYERQYEAHRGILILILGILGIVMCGAFTAIPAWIMGSGDLAKIAAGRMDPDGKGMTMAGYVLGIIGTILSILTVLWLFFMFVVLASLANR